MSHRPKRPISRIPIFHFEHTPLLYVSGFKAGLNGKYVLDQSKDAMHVAWVLKSETIDARIIEDGNRWAFEWNQDIEDTLEISTTKLPIGEWPSGFFVWKEGHAVKKHSQERPALPRLTFAEFCFLTYVGVIILAIFLMPDIVRYTTG